jgi:hypothetical protein
MGKVGGQNEILDFCWSPFVRMAPSASVAMPCLPVSSVATSLLGSGQSGELVIIRGGLGHTCDLACWRGAGRVYLRPS